MENFLRFLVPKHANDCFLEFMVKPFNFALFSDVFLSTWIYKTIIIVDAECMMGPTM